MGFVVCELEPCFVGGKVVFGLCGGGLGCQDSRRLAADVAPAGRAATAARRHLVYYELAQ